ncbi:hypothetical protein RND81_02G045000 [Saponaria officinalis]|uniref:Uncharacterized protein n=1 Tax=Saponaria officinalis TaxID=3572 RepID=A0AAW1MRQ9_SAPOF
MNGNFMLKKPKTEITDSSSSDDDDHHHHKINNNNNTTITNSSKNIVNSTNNVVEEESESISGRDDYDEQEEALVALFEHRSNEVAHLRKRISYYTSQLEQAEQRVKDTENKLVRIRRKISEKKSNNPSTGAKKDVKPTYNTNSPGKSNEGASQRQPPAKPPLVISNVSQKPSRSTSMAETVGRATPSQSDSPMKGRSHGNPESEDSKSQAAGTKRKLEQKEHTELVPLVRSSPSPSLIRCNASTHISSQHKRKLRSLALCPVNDKLFITSALDGVVNLWQIQARGSGATRLSSLDCPSPKQRRWPEDIAWHPEGSKLVAVYSADGGDNQISVLDLNKSQSNARVSFLEEKPHVKGIINSISFMPWDDTYFVTGGSDHAVIFWKEEDGKWKPKPLHRNLHSSAVMGVSGMQHKQMVVSAGADKRIIGYDVLAGRADYKHQIESKCMSVVTNPRDFNLFMVQTGTPERQLRLFDIRLRHSELHVFGWKQESSESQSALINQAWSPDGLYISSGSADPMIHIFDIRYNSHKPSQSVQAHQKRVFKADWHASLPLLISISSDLNIGLHKI